MNRVDVVDLVVDLVDVDLDVDLVDVVSLSSGCIFSFWPPAVRQYFCPAVFGASSDTSDNQFYQKLISTIVNTGLRYFLLTFALQKQLNSEVDYRTDA